MPDIQVYEEHPQDYIEYQNSRPDYSKAIQISLDLAERYLTKNHLAVIADFCGGTRSNSKKLAEKVGGLQKVTIVDTNSDFLKIAAAAGIDANQIETLNDDILKVSLPKIYDLVLAIFAYHHVPDSHKKLFVEKAKSALKPGGHLILAEMFFPDKKTVINYYESLIQNIPDEERLPGLEEFLMQTANSSNFEFKVSKDFCENQFLQEEFQKLEEVKIWPDDSRFDSDIGTFVQVYKMPL